MATETESTTVLDKQREQMLKLVSRSFYKELVNYGVNQAQVLTVAGHLLDNVMQNSFSKADGAKGQNQIFKTADVIDDWSSKQRLAVQDVSIRPIDVNVPGRVAAWLSAPAVYESFYPGFPKEEAALSRYLLAPTREYFAIHYQDTLAGIIGAESIDPGPAKMEMRKLVGDAQMRGKGIGKRATFLFLYYAFIIRNFNKVYVYSMDTNVRNLHLNARFGFELEGVFLEEAVVRSERRDVVRMGLCKPTWLKLFS